MSTPASGPSRPPRVAAAVSRVHRLLDVLSTTLVAIGATLFSIAFVGLRRMHETPIPGYTQGMAIEQLSHYYRLSVLSWAGLAIILLGVSTAIVSWLRHRTAQRVAS